MLADKRTAWGGLPASNPSDRGRDLDATNMRVAPGAALAQLVEHRIRNAGVTAKDESDHNGLARRK